MTARAVIDARLRAILARPEMWAVGAEALEAQVMLLMELADVMDDREGCLERARRRLAGVDLGSAPAWCGGLEPAQHRAYLDDLVAVWRRS